MGGKKNFNIALYHLIEATKVFFKEVRGIYPYTGDKYHCPVCNSNLKYFNGISHEKYLKNLEDNAFMHPFFLLETSSIVNFACPSCGATDRDRLFVLYFNKILSEYKGTEKLKLLEFGPQKGLAVYFRNQEKLSYRTADLMLKNVDDNVDITDMKIYADNTYDIFICSHILEHVPADRKALAELYRVTKPGGWGIIMVPLILSLEKTYENDAVTTDGERWHHFMQDDHCRQYAKSDFVQKIEDQGFILHQLDAKYFGLNAFEKNGIQSRSVLYIAEVPAKKK